MLEQKIYTQSYCFASESIHKAFLSKFLGAQTFYSLSFLMFYAINIILCYDLYSINILGLRSKLKEQLLLLTTDVLTYRMEKNYLRCILCRIKFVKLNYSETFNEPSYLIFYPHGKAEQLENFLALQMFRLQFHMRNQKGLHFLRFVLEAIKITTPTPSWFNYLK